MMGDKEYWKKATYSKLWDKHKINVEKLENELIARFPSLKNAIKIGLGAKTTEWLKIPPNEKNEADFELFDNYNCFAHIEVSGSDKISMPYDIWIRPGKIEHAEKKPEPTWFYMIYSNEIRVVDLETAKKFRDKIKNAQIKKDPSTGAWIPEKYCKIPYEESKSPEEMFEWIKEKLTIGNDGKI